MKLGFLTGALGEMPLEKKLTWASEQGFSHVEISCWPRENTRDYSGSDIDVCNRDPAYLQSIQTMVKQCHLEISALAYYDNLLHEDLALRKAYQTHLLAVIAFAERLGVPLVGTFIGRDNRKSIAENMEEFERAFRPIVEEAEGRGVKLMIENCPMPVWDRDGLAGTVSYSPELWRELFRRIPSDSFGLNYDPSHLLWLQIDHLRVLDEFHEKIFHVHAKDTKFNRAFLYDYGIYGKQLNKDDPFDLGWIVAKMPGLGDIDWKALVQKLKDVGYQGVISIEHEDRDYEGSVEQVQAGLLFSKHHLEAVWKEVYGE